MHILVTGSTGRIGANIVKRLVRRGHRVRCQVRPDSDRAGKLAEFPVEIVRVDLADRDGLTETVRDVDAIVHMGVKLRGPSNFEHLDVNIAPTLTLLEAVRRHNPRLHRFVYGSSDALYPHGGYMPELIREEQKLTRPAGMYAVSKVAGEAIVQTYHMDYGIPTVALNIPLTFCGKELLGIRTKEFSPAIADQLDVLSARPAHPLIDRAINALRAAREAGNAWVVPMCAQGGPWVRHMGDVRDVVNATEAALVTERGIGGAYVIMSDAMNYGIGVAHLAAISRKAYSEVPWPFSEHYWYDTARTRRELGYEPEFDSARMIEDAWRHLQGEDIGVVDVGPNTPIGGDRTL